jgi:glutamine amidotransferase
MSDPPYRATVIDAGVGNLANLARALAAVGAEAEVTDDPRRVEAARCLLLPGVGAFAPPRERLAESGLETALRAALDRGAALLGVCVGYQLLFEGSEEFGDTPGLGLLPGRVTALPDGVPRPHIGWNRLHDLADHPLLAGLPEEPFVYFVHGFAPEGVPPDAALARATHGRVFPAVAGRGRVLGTQFHPEKSGAVGLRILASFLALAHDGAPAEASWS